MAMRRALLLPLLLIAAQAVGGCGGGAESGSTPSATSQRQTLGAGGPVVAEISVAPTELTTAERVTVAVEVRSQNGWRAQAPDVAGALPANWTMIEQRAEPAATSADGSRTQRWTWTVEPFLDGTFSLGALTISAAPPSEEEAPVALTTQPVEINVRAVLTAEEAEPAGIKSVVEPPPPDRTWLWVGAGAAAVVLTGVAWWLIARARRAKPVAPVTRAAHELAFERLDELLRAGLIERGQFKELYTGASMILRGYIEDRFHLHAPRRTTEEFLAESRVSLALSGDDIAALERFFRACDEVKYAAAEATRTQAEAIVGAVREFVERTRSPEALVELEAPAPQEAAA